VGKVGEDSPLFVVPLDSAENKSNIANFFSKPISPAKQKMKPVQEENAGEDLNSETHAPVKRKFEGIGDDLSPTAKRKAGEIENKESSVKTAQRKPTKRAPPTVKKSLVKKEATTKITNFFGTK
jgi:hypothetical protein